MLPDVWAGASRVDRFQVHHVAPTIIRQMFQFLVQPGVYETIGLDGWATWKAVNKLPERLALLAVGTRPVLQALLAADIVQPGRIPTPWRKLCQVDAGGDPVQA